MKKGFTLVEGMIILVIVGLLAAMAIPACQQISLAKEAKTRGISVMEYKYQKGMLDKEQAERYRYERDNGKQETVTVVTTNQVPEEIVLNGRKYRLVK
jgi:Tfp pilus assembly protein PilE